MIKNFHKYTRAQKTTEKKEADDKRRQETQTQTPTYLWIVVHYWLSGTCSFRIQEKEKKKKGKSPTEKEEKRDDACYHAALG